MKLSKRLLFVGAHCDDVELFAGGLLARACEEGLEVGVLVFSDHRGVLPDQLAAQSREDGPQVRGGCDARHFVGHEQEPRELAATHGHASPVEGLNVPARVVARQVPAVLFKKPGDARLH